MLPNRIVMAPMTRHRADADGTPNALMAEHYAQRASAGLIITEGVHPSAVGRGYFFTPCLYNDRHQAGWAAVADAVHGAGGRIFMQLMHNGRIAFAETNEHGVQPVAPSAVQPDPAYRGCSYRCPRPRAAYPVPRELTNAEVWGVIADYRQAAMRAFAAGFDGVEVHGASGYLPNQFLCSNTNLRTDEFGGTIEKRARFMLELMESLAEIDGPARVAIKLAPSFRFHDVHDETPVETYGYLISELNRIEMAYMHVSDHEEYYSYRFDGLPLARTCFKGTLIASNGFNRKTGARTVAAGLADAIAFGTSYIANPDLVERIGAEAPLAEPDPMKLYTQGADGYNDYKTLAGGWVPGNSLPNPLRSSARLEPEAL